MSVNNELIRDMENLYLQYYSVSKIAELLYVNRKVVSFELKKLGYIVHSDTGYNKSNEEKYRKAMEEYISSNIGIAELSRKYCFDPCRFSLYLNNNGIEIPGGKIAKRLEEYKPKLNEAVRLYEEKKMGVRKISKLLDIPRHYISYYINKCGNNTIEDNKLYSIDESIFETLDNEEKVYWFGYLLADGNIQINSGRYVLELTSKDEEHLYKFRRFMKTNAPVKEKKVKLKNKVHINYRISIHDKKVVTDLIKLGLRPAKSLKIKFPSTEIVPEKFRRHFIRGYFDGDGHLSPFKRFEDNKEQCFIIFVGTKAFLQQLPEIFGVELNKLTQKGKIFSLRYGGNRKAFGILRYLYDGAKIYLDRKYNEYIKWKKHLIKNNN